MFFEDVMDTTLGGTTTVDENESGQRFGNDLDLKTVVSFGHNVHECVLR